MLDLMNMTDQRGDHASSMVDWDGLDSFRVVVEAVEDKTRFGHTPADAAAASGASLHRVDCW